MWPNIHSPEERKGGKNIFFLFLSAPYAVLFGVTVIVQQRMKKKPSDAATTRQQSVSVRREYFTYKPCVIFLTLPRRFGNLRNLSPKKPHTTDRHYKDIGIREIKFPLFLSRVLLFKILETGARETDRNFRSFLATSPS